jgi:hypothetical protein
VTHGTAALGGDSARSFGFLYRITLSCPFLTTCNLCRRFCDICRTSQIIANCLSYKVTQCPSESAHGKQRPAKSGKLGFATTPANPRHVKTFARKEDADAFIAKVKVEVREGVHAAER